MTSPTCVPSAMSAWLSVKTSAPLIRYSSVVPVKVTPMSVHAPNATGVARSFQLPLPSNTRKRGVPPKPVVASALVNPMIGK
jgi:hypothetical protein